MLHQEIRRIDSPLRDKLANSAPVRSRGSRNSRRILRRIEAAFIGGLFHFKPKRLAPWYETDITDGRVNVRCRW